MELFASWQSAVIDSFRSQKGLIMIKPSTLFASSVLALAIAGVSASSFQAITSGAEAYRRAVEFSQSQLSSTPNLTTPEGHDDPHMLQSRFILAWVLGADSIINMIRRTPIDPWASLRKKLGEAEWTRVISFYPPDNNVITILVKMPESPWEAVPVLSAVRKHSLMFAVEDGSGELSIANTFFGRSLG